MNPRFYAITASSVALLPKRLTVISFKNSLLRLSANSQIILELVKSKELDEELNYNWREISPVDVKGVY